MHGHSSERQRFWAALDLPTTTERRAREIMGKNFLDVADAITHLGINPPNEQFICLNKIPFEEETLEVCKDTHVLVAVFPMSLLDIRGACKGQQLFYEQDWYNKQAFAKQNGEVAWQLIRKTPADVSMSKTWDEQRDLLGKEEEVPSVCAVVYAMIVYFMTTGERLFENIYVRCSDLDSDGRRVVVGGFDAGGLDVSYCWDGYYHSDLGLSAARKS